jgi:hypothetical protein
MSFSPTSTDRYLSIHLALSQYPILSARIHARMRRELFERGIITPQAFETKVREMAITSQQMEGLRNPYSDEVGEIWDTRLARVRDQLTDLLFSEHLAFNLFQKLVNDLLKERGVSTPDLISSLNPELAPAEVVFEHAMTIERMSPQERSRYEARLQESKVVLIRSMISDQLRYINIAKEWFTLSDLAEIRRRKIGTGRIGGKAAGMLLAARVLNEVADEQLKARLHTPESFFIGSDEMYTLMSINNLVHWNDQKYKEEKEMRAEYPQIVTDFEASEFPPDISEQLESLLDHIGHKPVIVRSSSLLEDNFGTSFAGKYDSIFVPNQDKPHENLRNLQRAISHVYASTLNPNALLYRRSKGLLDYDERMAILIQEVQGERFGRYYLPHAAGVGFSRNVYRWAPQIRREDGFVRLVWGLGTRAVDRVGNDYPRLVALSHPLLRPSTEPKAIRRYSQQFVDLIDLEDNAFKTLPIHEVLSSRYPPLRFLVQLDEDGYFVPLHSNVIDGDHSRLVLTFDELLKRTNFAEHMRQVLHLLEASYHSPVDTEFTLSLHQEEGGKTVVDITLLQCRPQSHLVETSQAPWPVELPQEDVIFSTRFVVPQGYIERVDYVVFIQPEAYFKLPSEHARQELRRNIAQLNAALRQQQFICVGPGRWGSSNSDLGVAIDYGDIYHTRALVELSGQGIGALPEPSLGTHFFQDMMEAQIYPLAIVLDDPQTIFNRRFFYELPNRVKEWVPVEASIAECLDVVKVSDYRPGCHLTLVMSDEKGQAIAYLEKDRSAPQRGEK